jgi:hypothetical protein
VGDRIALPAAPRLCAAELAAEMAGLFAFGLVQDQRVAAVADPHLAVHIDGATRFTMHELLCELRNLSWFDARIAFPQADPAANGPAEAGNRRYLRWNSDRQLTLCSLLRGGIARRGGGPLRSVFWDSDHATGMAQDPTPGWPPETAPMSDWLGWCARKTGAGLRLPGPSLPRQTKDTSLGERAEALHWTPAARPFHNAALVTLARGTAMADGLPQEGVWTGARLMSLMAEAEALAQRYALYQTGHPHRMPRPAVMAARMTVWLGREERPDAGQGALYREAAEELATAAPNLLEWVSRANRVRRGAQRFAPCLFLPLAAPHRLHLNPSDIAPHAIVAGALATLIKAVFDTSRRTQLQMVGTKGSALALEDQIDRLAADVAVLRAVSGGYYAAESHQELRLGQSIALQLLRQRLEADNRSARLSLRDFDGRSLQVLAHPRISGRGHAELWCNGDLIAWPQEAGHPAGHLTAVV